mmetsp:Transcript_62132/g.187439  ORF Transcript_62132/g.187439 Transcript_62132/m.187439 type:complete len:121 (+) Transcript_62132:336-698(+)
MLSFVAVFLFVLRKFVLVFVATNCVTIIGLCHMVVPLAKTISQDMSVAGNCFLFVAMSSVMLPILSVMAACLVMILVFLANGAQGTWRDTICLRRTLRRPGQWRSRMRMQMISWTCTWTM